MAVISFGKNGNFKFLISLQVLFKFSKCSFEQIHTNNIQKEQSASISQIPLR